MKTIANQLEAYIESHPFDPGDNNGKTVLDQLYQVYSESPESDPQEVQDGFMKLEELLCNLPLKDNNAVFELCCRLCIAYERKAFTHGVQYGAHLINRLAGSLGGAE